jgi:hypothetical protein
VGTESAAHEDAAAVKSSTITPGSTPEESGPSSSSRITPIIDRAGHLTGLYIEPGTIASSDSPRELAGEILRAIQHAQGSTETWHHLSRISSTSEMSDIGIDPG